MSVSLVIDGTTPDDRNCGFLTLSKTVNEQSMNQAQVISKFLDDYYPNTLLAAPAPSHMPACSLLHFMIGVDTRSATISSAIDTICLAHLATKINDQRIVRASQESYGSMLALLRRVVVHSKSERPLCSHREIVATILALSLMPASVTGKNPDRQDDPSIHILGASQYIEAHGTCVFDQSEKMDLLLLQNVHLHTVIDGVARRKAIVFNQPQWRKLDNLFGKNVITAQVMADLEVPLPSLLEMSDAFIESSESATVLQAQKHAYLARKLDALAEGFCAWFETASESYYFTINVADTHLFDIEIEEHCFMTTSRVFPTMCQFVNPGYAFTYGLLNLFGMIADCTLLRVMYHGSAKEGLATGSATVQSHVVEERALAKAKELCRCTYFFSTRSLSAAQFL